MGLDRKRIFRLLFFGNRFSNIMQPVNKIICMNEGKQKGEIQTKRSRTKIEIGTEIDPVNGVRVGKVKMIFGALY